MTFKQLLGTSLLVLCGVSLADAALLGRLPATPGGTDYQVYYDDVLGITWLTDANAGGSMTWDDSVAWADSLSLFGHNDWRLSSMDVNGDESIIDCNGASEMDCRDNELGYMYYYNLGGVFGDDLSGDPIPFTNVQRTHWAGTESVICCAWTFDFDFGGQADDLRNLEFGAWAVADGDVFIPLPAAFWLLASGLLGLAGLRRRGRRR